MNKLLKETKIFIVTLLIGLFVLPFCYINSINVSATSNVGTIELIDEETTNSRESNSAESVNPEEVLPSVTMDEAINHLEGKVFDVVKLLQVIGKPICIVGFIICAILTLVGTFGQSGYVIKGLIGMFISAVSYTCILFSPQIINFFSTWLST